MLRLLSIHVDPWHGGAAQIALTLHKACLNDQRFEARFLAGRGRPNPALNIDTLHSFPYMPHLNVAGFRLGGIEGMFSQRAWRKHLPRIREEFDVIHLHCAHGYYLPTELLKQLAKSRLIWTFHDFWAATGRCAVVPDECEGWKQSCRKCAFKQIYPASIRSDYSSFFRQKRDLWSRMSDTTIVVPSHVFKSQLEPFDLPFKDIRVIHNGVNTDIFKPAESPEKRKSIKRSLQLPEDNMIQLVYICNRVENPQKGFDLLVETCRQIDMPFRLIVIGQYSKKLEKIKGLPNIDVLFTGYLQDKSVLADYLRVSDFFVNPSLKESFGLTNLEALACGAVPIVFDLPVFRETISNRAFYAESMTSEGLCKTITEASGNRPNDMPAKRDSYIIDETFSIQSMIEKYQDLYYSF